MDSGGPSAEPSSSIESAALQQQESSSLIEICDQNPISNDSLNLECQKGQGPKPESPQASHTTTTVEQSEALPGDVMNDEVPGDGQTVMSNEVISISDDTISADQAPLIQIKSVAPDKSVESKAKRDENPTIFKALAIKLKKELIRTKSELQALRDTSDKEICDFQNRLKDLESTLEIERQMNSTKLVTLNAQLVNYKQQVEVSELDYQNLQKDFDSYKLKASQLLQQNKSIHDQDSHKKFEDDRYQRLKELNNEQTKRIATLEAQLASSLKSNKVLQDDMVKLQKQAESLPDKNRAIAELKDKGDNILRENENLKLALQRFRSKFNDHELENANFSDSNERNQNKDLRSIRLEVEFKTPDYTNPSQTINQAKQSEVLGGHQEDDANTLCLSQPTEDSQHNMSSSSSDGSASGYVHIKPNTFEIISRSTVLKDAQIQIENLTKAYLESENTNSLLSEQVKALKDEIRRMQRVSERMDLAENLEYLKNVLFKFLSLDANQVEQRKRLIPVLSTVLKLSPDESSKLNSMNFAIKPSMANSFFKL